MGYLMLESLINFLDDEKSISIYPSFISKCGIPQYAYCRKAHGYFAGWPFYEIDKLYQQAWEGQGLAQNWMWNMKYHGQAKSANNEVNWSWQQAGSCEDIKAANIVISNPGFVIFLFETVLHSIN